MSQTPVEEGVIVASSATGAMKPHSTGREIRLFLLVGIANVCIDWTLTYVFLFHTSWPHTVGGSVSSAFPSIPADSAAGWVAKAAAVAVATINGFVLNSRFTFGDRKHVGSRQAMFGRFALVILISLVLNSSLLALLLAVLHAKHGLGFWFAQAVSTGAATVWNFAGSKYWVFRAAKDSKD